MTTTNTPNNELTERLLAWNDGLGCGVPIRVEITPEGVRAVDPADAVVSIVPRDVDLDELGERLCHDQHFFASSDAAESWRRGRSDVIVAPVADAFEPLRRLMERWTPETSEVA